jgi:hypothetical protein
MTRPRKLCALALLVAASSLTARQRAVTPGASGHCVTGVIAKERPGKLLVADDSYVYWINALENALYRVAKTGGRPERVARLEHDFADSMAVDDMNVYLGVQRYDANFAPLPGAILSIPKSGGVPVTLASGLGLTPDVHTDATHVYWLDSGMPDPNTAALVTPGKIERARKDGTGRETIASNLSAPFEMALDDDTVFFGEGGTTVGSRTLGLRAVPKSGGAVRAIENEIIVWQILPMGADLVVAGYITSDTQAIYVARKDGGGVHTLIESKNFGGSFSVFDGIAYYFLREREENVLWSVPVTGGTRALVRNGLSIFTIDFDIDACAITVATAGHTIERIKR